MKPFFYLILLAVLIQSCGGKATTQQTNLKDDAIPVQLLPLTSETAHATIEAAGLLTTEDEASLSFKMGGIIEAITVAEGQQVRKGQLLASIKPAEVAAQVAQVELSVAKAQRDFQRARSLYQDSVATLEQLQNAQTGLELAQQSQRQVTFNSRYAGIYAPADGFIVKKLGSVGELASPGTTVLVMNAVSANSRWVLKLGLPDRQWASVAVGDHATVQFDAFPGKSFDAVVSKKALAATAATGSFEVELRPQFNGLQPGAGMFGKAVIRPQGKQQVFAIPYESLLEATGKEGFVFVSDDRRTVKRVAVQLGTVEANRVQVTSGLEGHAFLVSAGSPYLTNGSRIKAAPL